MSDGFFGGTKQTGEYKPEKYDPYSAAARSAADKVATRVQENLPAAEQTAGQASDAFSRAAADPNFESTILPEYAKTIRGDYLSPQGNPALSAWLANMDAASSRTGATQGARLTSRLAATGVNPVSTAYVQANQGALAANRAALETAKASTIASNFSDERNRMLQSGAAYGTVAAQPGTLYNMGTTARLSPYTTAAQAINSAALPYQYVQSERSFQKNPGIADYLTLGANLFGTVMSGAKAGAAGGLF